MPSGMKAIYGLSEGSVLRQSVMRGEGEGEREREREKERERETERRGGGRGRANVEAYFIHYFSLTIAKSADTYYTMKCKVACTYILT